MFRHAMPVLLIITVVVYRSHGQATCGTEFLYQSPLEMDSSQRVDPTLKHADTSKVSKADVLDSAIVNRTARKRMLTQAVALMSVLSSVVDPRDILKLAQSRVIYVHFFDGALKNRERILQIAKEWERCGNFTFKTTPNKKDAAIRITMRGNERKSYIGCKNIEIEITKPTMWLGNLNSETPENEFRHVVLHEFGHALGLQHEHQSANFNYDLDVDCVKGHMGMADARIIEREVITRITGANVEATQFDRLSVMLYYLPRECFRDEIPNIGLNDKISLLDSMSVTRLYGPRI